MSFDIVIPARFASTRLPGKPLIDMAGKTLVQRVYEAAQLSDAERIVVATDDQRIADEVTRFGGEFVMTAVDHPSGTDRIAEVVKELDISDDRIVVNLQGDEPFAPAKMINTVAKHLVDHSDAVMSTASHKISDPQDVDDPNVVKVIADKNSYALYFSRSRIPFARDPEYADYSKHIGIYAYRANFVRDYAALEQSSLEKAESLEQLRVLANGYKISVAELDYDTGFGIDTKADMQKALAYLQTL